MHTALYSKCLCRAAPHPPRIETTSVLIQTPRVPTSTHPTSLSYIRIKDGGWENPPINWTQSQRGGNEMKNPGWVIKISIFFFPTCRRLIILIKHYCSERGGRAIKAGTGVSVLSCARGRGHLQILISLSTQMLKR